MSWLEYVLVAAAVVVVACGDNGEASSVDANVGADAPPLTWTSFAQDFMETYCYACHGPGDAMRDFSQLSMVRAEKDKIRCGVSPTALSGCTIPAGQFPVGTGPKPSDAERNQLVQWIDEGTVE
jgi:hypothetical protein